MRRRGCSRTAVRRPSAPWRCSPSSVRSDAAATRADRRLAALRPGHRKHARADPPSLAGGRPRPHVLRRRARRPVRSGRAESSLHELAAERRRCAPSRWHLSSRCAATAPACSASTSPTTASASPPTSCRISSSPSSRPRTPARAAGSVSRSRMRSSRGTAASLEVDAPAAGGATFTVRLAARGRHRRPALSPGAMRRSHRRLRSDASSARLTRVAGGRRRVSAAEVAGVRRGQRQRSGGGRTSSRSRSPSPRKFSASTVTMIASPGKIVRWRRDQHERAAVVQHRPPRRRRRLRAEPEKAERRLGDDRRRHPEGRLDEDRRGDHRERCRHDDPAAGRTERARRLDELALAQAAHLAAHESRVARPADRAERHHDVAETRRRAPP